MLGRLSYDGIGVWAWYDYLAWANPITFTQPVLIGRRQRQWLLGATACQPSEPPAPSGVVFHKDPLFRLGAHGDNWCITWAADGSQVTSMCDGDWLDSGHG